ncbi:MAG: hypothetical protein AB7P40_01580 [Chloroflexota bacterium]
MSAPHFVTCLDEAPEHGFWYRVSSSAVLVGAGIGWTSLVIACCLAAPVSLALASRDDHRAVPHDDL